MHLCLHLARAGWVRWRDEVPKTPARPSSRNPLAVRIVLDDDSGFDLTEAGTKKSLAVYVVRDPAEVPGIARLGPDPLDDAFTREVLDAILDDAGRSQLKGVLRHQGTIAGIGNAYSDEILHAARMSPFKAANSLTDDERATLYAAVKGVLGDAVERSRGLAASELKGEKKSNLAVHGRTGQACPVCGDTVAEVSFADSSLQYCPTCQTGGKPLADRRMSRLLKWADSRRPLPGPLSRSSSYRLLVHLLLDSPSLLLSPIAGLQVAQSVPGCPCRRTASIFCLDTRYLVARVGAAGRPSFCCLGQVLLDVLEGRLALASSGGSSNSR